MALPISVRDRLTRPGSETIPDHDVKHLIVNADGYGFTTGVNRGIEETVERGIVTSISANSNCTAIEDLPSFVERFPHVSVGVHLNPVVGPSISDPSRVRSLVDSDGEFLGGRELTRRLLMGRIDSGELERESRLQIERVRAMGVDISHLDSHQNCHLYPQYFRILLALMREQRIPCMRTSSQLALAESPHPSRAARRYWIRQPKRLLTRIGAEVEMVQARRQGAVMADRLMSTSRMGYKGVQAHWSQLLRNVPKGWNEVYCHPGFPDEQLQRYSTYVELRQHEVDVMTSAETHREIERCEIHLRTFHDLARHRR